MCLVKEVELWEKRMTLEEVVLILLPQRHHRRRHPLIPAIGSWPEITTLTKAQTLLSTTVVPPKRSVLRDFLMYSFYGCASAVKSWKSPYKRLCKFFRKVLWIAGYQVIHHRAICLKNSRARTGGSVVKYGRLPQVLLYGYILHNVNLKVNDVQNMMLNIKFKDRSQNTRGILIPSVLKTLVTCSY